MGSISRAAAANAIMNVTEVNANDSSNVLNVRSLRSAPIMCLTATSLALVSALAILRFT